MQKLGGIEEATWVEGDLGVHFVYTAGVAGEEFLRSLAKKKILASTCKGCKTTYVPPRIFCEKCMEDVTDRHTVAGRGKVVSVTRVARGLDGPLKRPEAVAAIQLEGTDTTILHRVEDGVAIGDRVEAVWSKKPKGSILDIERFRRASGKK